MLQIGINIIVSAQPTGGPTPVHEQLMIPESYTGGALDRLVTEDNKQLITE